MLNRIRSKIASRSAGSSLPRLTARSVELLDVAAAARDRLVADLDGGDRQARAREHLGDAGTHGAQPHDADLVQFPGHAAISSTVGDRRQSLIRAAGGRPAG